MTTELAEAIAAGCAKADRNNLGPTVDYFYDLLQRFPENQYALYEYGGALDSAGRELEAVAELINLALDRLDGEDVQRYQRSLRGYAAQLVASRNS
jgi:hypothetical protein